MTVEAKLLPQWTEFETKYRIDGDKLYEFKGIVEKLDGLKEFVYVEGPDTYWTGAECFARYRKASHDSSGMAWLTFKWKPEGAKNNIKRKEQNLRVDVTPFEAIDDTVQTLGFKYDFKIYKMCHIYKFEEAIAVFYTVKNDKGNVDHFIEIEVDEEKISKMTEQEALDIIRKYEKVLKPLGITHRNRVPRSLYEMYTTTRGIK